MSTHNMDMVSLILFYDTSDTIRRSCVDRHSCELVHNLAMVGTISAGIFIAAIKTDKSTPLTFGTLQNGP